jgi:hypothetical protein
MDRDELIVLVRRIMAADAATEEETTASSTFSRRTCLGQTRPT